MKEICTLLVKLQVIIQVGCPTCCYQVCALDHANGGAADLDYGSEHCRRNEPFLMDSLVLGKCIYNFRYVIFIYIRTKNRCYEFTGWGDTDDWWFQQTIITC